MSNDLDQPLHYYTPKEVEDAKVAALKFSNRVRRYLGLPEVDHLYEGYPGDGYSCPITNTIYDDDLGRDAYIIHTSNEVEIKVLGSDRVRLYKVPNNAKRFIQMFDTGMIYELVKADWRIRSVK